MITAVILCGGKGQRLKPFTSALPKPLVPLKGKPLLYHLMGYLSASGVTRFILCTGYKSESIESFVRDQCPSAWKVSCSNAGDVSMADRLIQVRDTLPEGEVLICYGDTLANVDLVALRKVHPLKRGQATMTVFPLQSPFGLVEFARDRRVKRFLEKPKLPYWINIGFILCDRYTLRNLKAGTDLAKFLSDLAKKKNLYTYLHKDKHLTVNTEKEREVAEVQIVEFFTLF